MLETLVDGFGRLWGGAVDAGYVPNLRSRSTIQERVVLPSLYVFVGISVTI